MNRREFMKLSALIGGGLVLSSFTFGDNMGYFKMDFPAGMIHWMDGNIENKRMLCVFTYRVNSFEDFISKNWDINKSIFVYDVLDNEKYVRGAVLDIPHKSIIHNTMCFDRNFKRLEVLKGYA